MTTYKYFFSLDLKDSIQEVIRVDHAGEYGAKMIYKGQIDAILKTQNSNKKTHANSDISDILEMLQSELIHLAYFEKATKRYNFHYTIFLPLWHTFSYLLGYIPSYIFGKSGSMVTTQAIESVIEEHYLEQYNQLSSFNDSMQIQCNQEYFTDLKNNILKFREEELEHKDIGTHYFESHAGTISEKSKKRLYKTTEFIVKTAIMISKIK